MSRPACVLADVLSRFVHTSSVICGREGGYGYRPAYRGGQRGAWPPGYAGRTVSGIMDLGLAGAAR